MDISLLFYNSKKYHEAEQYVKKALSVAYNIHHTTKNLKAIECLILIGQIKTETEDYEQALLALKSAQYLASKLECEIEKDIEITKHIAKIFILTEKYSNAAKYYRKALNLANKAEI